jgi:hypothetical protein
VVPRKQDAEAVVLGFFHQGLVAGMAGAFFEAGRVWIQFDPEAGKGHLQTGGGAGAEGGVILGILVSESVIHVDREDPGLFGGPGQGMQQENTVSAP